MFQNKIKLIVSDLDGTLLNKEHKLSKETVQTVLAARKAGVETVIVTGRMCCSALPFYQELQLKMPLIAYNGSYVKDIKQDKKCVSILSSVHTNTGLVSNSDFVILNDSSI